jgi:hypothetical protein
MAQMCYLAPSAAAIFGADSPNFNFSNAGVDGYGGTNGTCYGVDDKSTKIVYFSPNFAGFSFAASFTPDNTEDTRNFVDGFGTRSDQDFGQNSENLSVAANFTHDFNGVNLNVGGGGTWSFDREGDPFGTDERHDYNAYAIVGFSGFTIGGALGIRQNRGFDGGDDLVYSGGVTYNWDAWTVGFGYSHGRYELVGGPFTVLGPNGVTVVTSATNDVVDDSNIFSLTASYALGPGIQIDAVAEYYDYQGDGDEGGAGSGIGTDRDFEGFAFGIGTLINF